MPAAGPRARQGAPYAVPTMEEARAVPPSGLRAVSTFSGAGGGCLGLRLAGFEVLWASEFVPAARECYAANFPSTPVDPRDIREVRAEDVLRAARLEVGELDLLEGSPPCASFSTAGAKSRLWGRVKAYSGTQQRTDDLFFEYARLVEGLRPRVFLAENVSGLIKGVSRGYYLEIEEALAARGYHVEARVLDASWLGVPQARQRVFFQGVRLDLYAAGARPAWPVPRGPRLTAGDACPWLVAEEPQPPELGVDDGDREVVRLSGSMLRAWEDMRAGRAAPDHHRQHFSATRQDPRRPAVTINAQHGHGGTYGPAVWHEPRRFTILELKRLCSFPDDFVVPGPFHKRYERMGRSVPPLMMKALAEVVRDGPLARREELRERA